MFPKLSTFRSKAKDSRSQKEKHNLDEDNYISKENQSYFSLKSSSTAKTIFKVPRPRFLYSNASERNPTSSVSFDGFSTYDGNESVTASSVISEEIDLGTHELLPYDDAEEQFLEEHEGYFLHLSVDNVRKDEYPRLLLQRLVYLDYATCPLYSKFQVEQHMQILLEGSGPYLSQVSTTESSSSYENNCIDITSKHLLKLFNTNQHEYTVLFTPGLASCFCLFAEMHQFQKGSILLVSPDSHESVKHVVDKALLSGAKVGSIPTKKKDLCFHGNSLHELLLKRGWSGFGCGIFVYPVQSYFSGMCHSPNWILGAQQNGWKVLLDATSCVPSVNIDLSLYQPEFVVGSLHHILGYPSEVAYLLVRRSSHSICTQKGLDHLKIAEVPEHGRSIHVVTEGEGLSLHTFAAFSFGLMHLETIGIVATRKRVDSLLAWLIQTLKSFKHKVDEKPLLQIYGSLDLKYRGSILAFNVLDSTGNVFAPGLVRHLAERSNIFLGVGSLSNLELSRLLHQKLERQSGSASADASIYNISAVRASLGPVSTFEDVYRLAQFLSRFSDEDYTSSEAVGYVEEHRQEC